MKFVLKKYSEETWEVTLMYIISLKLKFLRIYGDKIMLTADVFLLYYKVLVKSLLKETTKSGFPE
jgi:hypothetical protein